MAEAKPISMPGDIEARRGRFVNDTPILRLFREIQDLWRQGHEAAALGEMDPQDVQERFFDPALFKEAELLALPPFCAADFAAKMIVASEEWDFEPGQSNDPIWVEARNLTGYAA